MALQATTSESMVQEIQGLLQAQPNIIGAVLQAIRNGTFNEVSYILAFGLCKNDFTCLMSCQKSSVSILQGSIYGIT